MANLPPGPPPRFPMGELPAFRKDPIAYLRRVAAEYGDIVHFRVGPQPLTLVNDPDLIHQVLVTDAAQFHKGRGLERTRRLLGNGLLTSEEPEHLRHRRMLQPAFHRKRIAAYGQTMVDFAARAVGEWTEGDTIDLGSEMGSLTLSIAGKTLFDADLESEAPEIGQALNDALQLFHVLSLPFAELLEKLPLPPVIKFRRAKARLDDVVYRLIAERRAARVDRGDFLSLLLEAQDEDDHGTLSDQQIRDEAMTIVMAGHETTANGLTWTFYLLSENPDVEHRLVAEIESVLGGRLPTVDDVPKLVFTRAVVAEALRLYPPAWIIGRRSVGTYRLGPYELPKDSIVILAEVVTTPIRGSGRIRSASTLSGGHRPAPQVLERRTRLHRRLGNKRAPKWRIFRLGPVRARALESSSRGWSSRSCWRQSCNVGACALCRGKRSCRSRSSL